VTPDFVTDTEQFAATAMGSYGLVTSVVAC